MKRRLSLWLPVIVWCGVIFTLSAVPHLRITTSWWDFPLRKAAHMIEYGVLVRLLIRAFAGSTLWPRKKILAVSLSLAVVYAMSDETHQLFVAGRHGTPRDVLIDTAGACIALGFG